MVEKATTNVTDVIHDNTQPFSAGENLKVELRDSMITVMVKVLCVISEEHQRDPSMWARRPTRQAGQEERD